MSGDIRSHNHFCLACLQHVILARWAEEAVLYLLGCMGKEGLYADDAARPGMACQRTAASG